MKKYTALVKFQSGNEIYYPEFEARNSYVAITKIELDRQKKGDEMFIKSIKVFPIKKEKKNGNVKIRAKTSNN